MKHVTAISVQRASAPEAKQMDPFGAVFLQIWIMAMSMILGKIFMDG